MKFFTKRAQSKKGLSLLEVLVAVAIVGLAAAIGVPTYNKMSKDGHRKDTEKYLYQLVSSVRAQIRQHPADLTGTPNVNDDWVNNWQSNLKNYASLPAGTATNNLWISGSGNKLTRYFVDENNGILRLVALFSDNSSIYVDINGNFGSDAGGGNPNDQCNYAAQCNDGNPCTIDICDTGADPNNCVHTNANNKSCDDGDACTTNDICSGGTCAAGSQTNCNDNNPCTSDTCVSPTGCVYDPTTSEGQACTNANQCVTSPTCQSGTCTGTIVTTCDNPPQCHSTECDPVTGCNNLPLLPNGTLCNDDSNVCNGVETCQTGICEMTSPVPDCDDNNPCTADSCDPANGCVHSNLPQGTSCDNDNNLCNGNHQCNANGNCIPFGGAVICHPSHNFCDKEECNPTTGQCETIACPPGTVCNETLNQCTQCASDNDCDDGNACTINKCDLLVGTCSTITITNGNPCDNSLFCDGFDICWNGACAPQGNACPEASKPYCNESTDTCVECTDNSHCDDGNACTINKCDLLAGTCSTITIANGNPCDNSLFCDGPDVCLNGGICTPQGTPCTNPGKPYCIETNDTCVACTQNSHCNDNNPCTIDKCLGNLCLYAPKPNCIPPQQGTSSN